MIRPFLLALALALAGCASAEAPTPIDPTLPADDQPAVVVRPTTIPPNAPATTAGAGATEGEPEPTPTSIAEPDDPIAVSATCAELFSAAAPVLQAALAVLDDELGGQTERQILDLPSAKIDAVFEQMASVEGYDVFTNRRQALGCTSSAQVAECSDRAAEVDTTRLDPLLRTEWLRSLGCTEDG